MPPRSRRGAHRSRARRGRDRPTTRCRSCAGRAVRARTAGTASAHDRRDARPRRRARSRRGTARSRRREQHRRGPLALCVVGRPRLGEVDPTFTDRSTRSARPWSCGERTRAHDGPRRHREPARPSRQPRVQPAVAVVGGGPAGLMAAEGWPRPGSPSRSTSACRPSVASCRWPDGVASTSPTPNRSTPSSTATARPARRSCRRRRALRPRGAAGMERGPRPGDVRRARAGGCSPPGFRATRRCCGRGCAASTSSAWCSAPVHTWLGWDGDGRPAVRRRAMAPVTARTDAHRARARRRELAAHGLRRRVGRPPRGRRRRRHAAAAGELRVRRRLERRAPRAVRTARRVKDVAVAHGDDRARGDLVVITRAGIEGGPVYALGAALRDAHRHDGRTAVARARPVPRATRTREVRGPPRRGADRRTRRPPGCAGPGCPRSPIGAAPRGHRQPARRPTPTSSAALAAGVARCASTRRSRSSGPSPRPAASRSTRSTST